MLLKIVNIGNSGALILPEELMEHAHLAVDDTVLVTRDAGGLLIIGPARVEETASMLEERENIRQFDEAARAARGGV